MTNIHDYLDEMLSKSGNRNTNVFGPAAYTDQALAARFTNKYGEHLKFVNGWGRWLVWEGTRWRIDETLQVMYLCRMIAKEASSEVVNRPPSLIRTVGSASTVSAIERLARADRKHASNTGDWDADDRNSNAGLLL